MKFRHLIFANLLRKKIRTALTVGSFAAALFLFGILAVVRGAFSHLMGFSAADRLVVFNKVGAQLPLSYRDRLLKIPGVRQVTFSMWFLVVYQDERNFFPAFAVDTENYRTMFPEFIIADAQWAAFAADRVGCIVGEGLAKRFSWKIDDRIPIKHYALGSLQFNIRGIYQGMRPQDDINQFWIQWKFLEEKKWIKSSVGWYTVAIPKPDDADRVGKAIDQEFANSPWETRTDTETAFAASFVKQMGNVELLMLSIGGVVFFTLLLVTGNTMAIAVRERVGELAVLKAVGFSDVFVLLLVLIESLVVAALGGALGLGLAKLFTLNGDPTRGLLPSFYLPGKAIASGLALALLVGMISGMLPALSAMRLRVVQALRRV